MAKCILLVSLLAVPMSCSCVDSPIRTALIDLTGEARTIEVHAASFQVAEHKQVLSIGGLLNIPDIGQQFQFSGENDVTTAVGVAVAQSYRLIGEAPLPKHSTAVTDVRVALERSQALASQASLLTAEIEELVSRADRDETIQRMIFSRDLRRQEVERDLRKANEHLASVANQPGIIIARWTSEKGAGGNVESRSLEASAASLEAKSGFVILGGLRVVSLVLGEDFWWLLNNLREHEKPYIEEIGLTTSLIQAQDVAYTSDLLSNWTARLAATLDGSFRGEVSAARIEAYWSFVARYTNSGNLPRVTWVREPFCAVCSLDLPGLAKDRPDELALQKLFRVHEKEVDPASYQHWRSIAANITYLNKGSRWLKHAEQYASKRLMYPAPSCPFCGSNRRPAVIRNPRGESLDSQ